MVEKTLIPAKEYLKAGIHIGAKFKTEGMRKFIFKKRPDKLKVLDISTIDERIRIASRFLASFQPEKVVVVSQKEYGQVAVKKFAELTGAIAFTGRFVPGTFTNPQYRDFVEPAVVVVTDPNIDKQAVKEAAAQHVPIVALCSTDDKTAYIDLVIPCNNKGRKSLALVYWLLAREVLKARGAIKTDKEFTAKPEEFEFTAPSLESKK